MDKEHRSGLLKSAGIVSVAIAMSRITGLLRESVLSWLLGAGAIHDAYVLGFRIPGLTRELFGEGALSSAFVPTFTRYLTTKTHAEARELSNITGTVLLVFLSCFCAVSMVLSPMIVNIFAPGFHAVPGKAELAASLVRVMFPFLLLLALASQAQGILYATHSFGTPAVSPAIFNIVSVSSGLALGYWLGPRFGTSPVYGMAYGVVLGGAGQLAFVLPGVRRAGFAWRPQWNPRHEGVRDFLMLMAPAVIGNASGQVNILVNTNFAAGLRDAAGHVMNGPVSWLYYAYRFFSLPLGLFGIAIASAALPRLSRSAAQQDFVEFRAMLTRSILMILLLTIPAAVGLSVFGESMIGIVYQHGKFLAFDTHQTALALSAYAVGLAGYSSLKLIAPAWYALGNSRVPMIVSIVSVAVNAGTAFLMVRVAGFGHAGLALTSSVVSTFSAVTLLVMLRPKIGGVEGWQLLASAAKIVAAAVIMGIVCKGVVIASHVIVRTQGLARITDLLLGIPAGALSFYAAAAAMKVPELAQARAELLRKFRRAA